jgi:outer membrane murein-binding lipoprotein Lpp
MVRTRLFVTCVLAALFLTGSQPLLAADEYSDAKLQSFADAVRAVNAVVEEWRPQIQAAPNEADARQMAEKANEEMRAAVAGTEGITIEEYQAIAQAAQADAQLMARIDQALKETGPAAQ